MNIFSRFGKTKTIIGILVIVLIAWGAFAAFAHRGAQYQFVTVASGSITSIVSVTGNTTPIVSVDLGFQNGGVINAVNYAAGDTVNAGDVIASLDTSGLQAQLAEARANVDQENAKLESLETGPTLQSVHVSETQLGEAQQTLANDYAGVGTTLSNAYSKANDAVRNQLASFYTDPESSNPQLTFAANNQQIVNNLNFDRVRASAVLNAWEVVLASSTAVSSSSTLDTAIRNAATDLSVIKNLLNDASEAVTNATSLTPSMQESYQTDVTAGLTETNTAAMAVDAAGQSIASDNANVAELQAELALTLASSTPQTIAAQQAAVESAQASMENIQAEIAQSSIVSPIAGVITTQNAKVGEIAAPGAALVSLISNKQFEVDAEVPETDIGKVAIGDPVSMTLDAFPGETFTGKVFYVNPAETIISGVVDYEVKVSFDNADPRLKSGLTVNLDIQTQTDNNALIVPQFAIIQNASGTFVDIVKGGVETQVPVTLGIQDQNGNVEILSGVTAGEQVINIGLKAQ